MKLLPISIFLLLNVPKLQAQVYTKQASWQQKVNCDINVTLNPAKKILNAFISIDYFNNSPDTLRSLWMHAWPNAYKNTQTAFALQQLKNGKTEFEFSAENEKGYMNGFHFMDNGDSLHWHFDSLHIDIIEVILNKPLLPGTSIVFSTPFRVKLPKLFSRGGYKESFFAITQWYPKPAVYDVNGWNTMPYLDQGEFYSEYGDYKVNITLPEKYLVASTGTITTESERKLLDSIADNGKGLYANHSNRLKTISFSEYNIHDFAWFADTIFKVHRSFVILPNGDTVVTRMFVGKQERKTFYKGDPMIPVNETIKYYSQRVGNYPYKQGTVVIGSIFAGGGMEYPTITVCQRIIPGLIRHEVGHNWFYGILGNNERQYPWMDESINTFYEQGISRKLKGDSTFYKNFKGNNWLSNYESMTGYLFTARQGLSQPLNIPSVEFSNINYGSIVYCKGPLLFAYFKQQLGDSLFTKCMQDYFKKWQYRHPLPGDMQASFERTSGKKLDWFFTDLMNENNTIDIVKTNNGYQVKGSAKLDSFLKQEKVKDPNPFGFLPEKNYLNNGQKLKLLTVNIPYHLPRQNARIAMNLTPVAGYNYYDKFYFGAAIFNRTIFRKKFEYIAMPAYSFNSKRMVGYGKLNYLSLPKDKSFFKTETGVQGQSFGSNIFGIPYRYYRINPYIKFYFKTGGKIDEMLDKQLHINLYETSTRTSVRFNDSLPSAQNFFRYAKISYSMMNRHPINTFGYKVNAEYGYDPNRNHPATEYIKTWINTSYKYTYDKKNKYFKTELFAGVFLYKKGEFRSQQFFMSGNSGSKDYLYNEAQFGRNENAFSNNVLGRQIINTNGNMRNILPYASTDKWMLSVTNELCLPGIIPIKLYCDLGYYPYIKNVTSNIGTTSTLVKAEIYTTAGITLSLFKETIEIFVQLYQSKQFLKYNNYNYSLANAIGFKLNLNQLEPFKLMDNYRP